MKETEKNSDLVKIAPFTYKKPVQINKKLLDKSTH